MRISIVSASPWGTPPARHQSMHHFVARAFWDAEDVIEVARDVALSALERHAPVAGWIIDDTSFPKKGDHSVGVARQYSGTRGKTDNCQVAVTLSLANATMSVPCAVRLVSGGDHRPWALVRGWRSGARHHPASGKGPSAAQATTAWTRTTAHPPTSRSSPPAGIDREVRQEPGTNPMDVGHVTRGDDGAHALAIRVGARSRGASRPTSLGTAP